MNFRQYIEIFEPAGEGFYGPKYRVRLAGDSFVHFTTRSRADQIIRGGALLMEPPHPKFGTDSVDAVSVNYGKLVPSVQSTHIRTDPRDPVVAVHFKTNVPPYAAYPEEIKWNTDVPLQSARVISQAEAVTLLRAPNAFRRHAGESEYELQYY